MIEKQLPLDIPPGLVMNGSKMEKAGRWMDGNYVRFHNGVAQPMGGTSAITLHVGTLTGGPTKGMYRFWTTDGGSTLIVAQHTQLHRIYNFDRGNGGNEVDVITPSGGLPDEGDVNGWSMTNMGETLLITNAGWPTANGTGMLWGWTSPAGAASLIDTSFYRGVFVTPENFMVLINNINELKWASQGTFDVLTPAVGNSAGGLDVPSPYLVISGRALVGESLVWTTGDLWALTYVGGDLIYGLRKVGDNCGILGANNVSIVNGVARWMGQGGFFEYDGYVRPLECPLSEFIFSSINKTHAHRFFTVHIPQFSAIQFWYMSLAVGDYCDRFVEYNYANNTWTKGSDVRRAAGASEWPVDVASSQSGTMITAPVFADNASTSALLLHEQSGVLTSDADSSKPYLESGPIHLDEGRVARVQKIILDGANSTDTVSLFAGRFPQDTEVEQGPNTVTFGTNIDVRFTARYARYKQTFTTAPSRVGIPRLGIIPGGSNR